MKIMDSEKQMYSIEVDTKNRIVHEKNIGFWKLEDFKRFDNEYRSKIEKELNKSGIKPWAKISDLTEYKMSSIVDELQNHVTWLSSKGWTHCAVILPEKMVQTVKLQMKRSAQTKIKENYFASLLEAKKWLATEGFNAK